jgi:amino acid transporter
MKPPAEDPGRPGLVRVLGPMTATAVVVGTTIGSGVFMKAQKVAANVDYSGIMVLAWVLIGLLALLGALAYGEVAVLLPRAGGNYVFLREGYGRLAGFLWGWVEFWIIRSASIAALATLFTTSLNDLLADPALQQRLGLGEGFRLGFWPERWVTVAVVLALTGVNVLGVRWGGGLQLVVTLIKIGSLVAIAALPFLAIGSSGPMADPGLLRPVWPDDWRSVRLGGVASAFLAVLWAYHGWMNVAPVAEEVRRPQRNLPLALLAGVGILITLYVGANVAYSLVLSRPEMAQTTKTPVATAFCLRVVGPLGTALASGAILMSTFGAINGNLLVGPRMLYAMSSDRLAPGALRWIHPRFHTPAWAILAFGAWSALLVVAVAGLTEAGWLEAGKAHFDRLTDFAMFGAVIFETLAVLTIFVFRRTRPDAPRPYRCPGYPVVPALYVVLPACILTNMFVNERAEAVAGVAFIALGTVAYFALGLGKTAAAAPAKG